MLDNEDDTNPDGNDFDDEEFEDEELDSNTNSNNNADHQLESMNLNIKQALEKALVIDKNAEQIENIEKENTDLKFKVEELKKELETAEALKGPLS